MKLKDVAYLEYSLSLDAAPDYFNAGLDAGDLASSTRWAIYRLFILALT